MMILWIKDEKMNKNVNKLKCLLKVLCSTNLCTVDYVDFVLLSSVGEENCTDIPSVRRPLTSRSLSLGTTTTSSSVILRRILTDKG